MHDLKQLIEANGTWIFFYGRDARLPHAYQIRQALLRQTPRTAKRFDVHSHLLRK
jgi:hypothetical protein